MDLIAPEHSVLLLNENTQRVENLTNEIKSKSREMNIKKPSELLNDQNATKYDVVIFENLLSYSESDKLYATVLKMCKPLGKISIQQAIIGSTAEQFISKLKISGYINISEPKTVEFSSEEKTKIQQKLNTTEQITVIEVIGSKPGFELGSSAKLNLKPKSEISSVWKIDDTVDDEVETIDPDNLLDEDDLKKPDSQGLRVCTTTGKRKACKDCSCGLADELAMEKEGEKVINDMPKSSCGSCYLGDAFRCASCPYRGMPAFKPGEKIALTNDQLQPDL